MEILRRILASPQTISSLGVVMERHPAWIRHHVKALEAAGLVELAEERTTRNYTEKFYAATAPAFAVSMFVRPGMGEDSRIVAMVSDDFAIEALAEDPGHRVNLSAAVTGSLDGLMGLRQGFADVAGCHLLDTDTGEYNIPYVRHFFPDRDIVITTVAHREQGLLVAPGNPLALRSLEDVVEKQARFVNRNPGSGTRIWLDRRLSALGIPSESVRGYSDVVDTHRAAARRVAAGYADAAVGVALAAESHGLDFVALFEERYDLVMTEEAHQTVEIARFIDRIQDRAFKRTVGSLSGYDNSATGDERLVKL
jgi:putative molybdopterin biosynthesis protein